MNFRTRKIFGFIVVLIAIGIAVPSGASAQSQAVTSNAVVPAPSKIADNDGIFIDGKNFTVTPGRAKGDASAQVRTLGARALGPGAIVFRSGEKLYIVSAPLLLTRTQRQAGGDVYADATQIDRPNQIRIQYDPPKNPDLQALYGRLKDHHYLEMVQKILSPLRLPEELTIKTTECGVMNAWYRRENSDPTVTICYELLKTISQSMPKQTTADGITPMDAVVGQALWLVLHETGHAVYDIFNVPIFGHNEDAADNFATYIMLQFGKDDAKRLIGGAAWAWRGYIADYRTNPVIQEQLVGFASNHGQPQERFYNLMCLAYGADPVTFANLTQEGFLPPTRAQDCKYDYKTLADAFHQEVGPHIDRRMAERVMHSAWLPAPASMPTAQK